MYGNDELAFLSKLRGDAYALPLDYETPKLAREILCRDKEVEIRPTQKISLKNGAAELLTQGFTIDIAGHKKYCWDNAREQLIPEELGIELTTEQYLNIMLGKEMGETDVLLQYLLGEFLTLCVVHRPSDCRVVIDGEYEVGEIILYSLDYNNWFEIQPTSKIATTKPLVGVTEAVYDREKLKQARLMAKDVKNIVIALTCIEAEESHAEFRVLGDEDGCVVLFNAKINREKPGYAYDLSPGEHTLMAWSIGSPMAIVEYAPIFFVDKSARDAYTKFEAERRAGK